MVRVCSECGAEILNHAKHVEFHGKIDELIEWAQSVSKLFGKNEPSPEGSLSRHDGEMDTEHEARESNILDYGSAEDELQAGPQTTD